MWTQNEGPPDSLTKWFLFVGNYQFQRDRLIFKTCLYWKKHPRPKIDSPNWENESAHSAGLVPAVLHGFQDGLHRWFQFQWHFIAWNFGWVNSIHDAQGETISRSSPSLKMRNFWEKLGVQVISFGGTHVTMATGGSQVFPKLKRKIEEKNYNVKKTYSICWNDWYILCLFSFHQSIWDMKEYFHSTFKPTM